MEFEELLHKQRDVVGGEENQGGDDSVKCEGHDDVHNVSAKIYISVKVFGAV